MSPYPVCCPLQAYWDAPEFKTINPNSGVPFIPFFFFFFPLMNTGFDKCLNRLCCSLLEQMNRQPEVLENSLKEEKVFPGSKGGMR